MSNDDPRYDECHDCGKGGYEVWPCSDCGADICPFCHHDVCEERV